MTALLPPPRSGGGPGRGRPFLGLSLLAFALVRVFVLPGVVRAHVEERAPRLRFESLSLSVFRGEVQLEEVAFLDEEKRVLAVARSLRAPLTGDHLVLEGLSLAGDAGAVTSRVRVDRLELELSATGEVERLAARGWVLGAKDEPLVEAAVRVGLARDGAKLEARFDGSARAANGEDLGALLGTVSVAAPDAEGHCPARLDVRSYGEGFRLEGTFALAKGAGLDLGRRSLDDGAAKLRAAGRYLASLAETPRSGLGR